MKGVAVLLAVAGISGGWLSWPAVADQLPNLAVLTLQAPAAVTNGPYPVISVQWAVTNHGGPVPTGSSWFDAFYLSTNNLLDGTATMLILANWTSDWLATGSYGQTQYLALPITNSGTWFLHYKTDDRNDLAESDETNNVATLRLTATILPPDLRPLALVTPASLAGPPLPYLTLAWGVTNQGAGPADGPFHPSSDGLWISTNSYRDGTEQLVEYFFFTNRLEPEAVYWVTNRVRLPVIQSGDYYLILQTDPYNCFFESDTNNNTISVPLAFQATPPDLAPLLFEAPVACTGSPNPSLTFAWCVTNQGSGPAIGRIGSVGGVSDGWFDEFYLSTNSILDATATRIGYWVEANALAVGASYCRTNAFRLPVVASGAYYLFLVTDEFNGLYESDFSNNTASRPITLTIQPADLAPLPLVAPTVVTGAPGTLVRVIAGVTNQGIGHALNDPGGWFDRLELWTAPGFPGASWYMTLGQWQRTDPLSAGGAYWLTNTFAIPSGGGPFLLVFETDFGNALFESNETNDVVSAPLTLMIPPKLESPVLGANGSFSANALATLGFSYTLQVSSNLVHWSGLATFNYTSWPMTVGEPAAAEHPQRFYRLVQAPGGP